MGVSPIGSFQFGIVMNHDYWRKGKDLVRRQQKWSKEKKHPKRQSSGLVSLNQVLMNFSDCTSQKCERISSHTHHQASNIRHCNAETCPPSNGGVPLHCGCHAMLLHLRQQVKQKILRKKRRFPNRRICFQKVQMSGLRFLSFLKFEWFLGSVLWVDIIFLAHQFSPGCEEHHDKT